MSKSCGSSLSLTLLFPSFRVIFIFHQNNNAYTKAKVKPPRLNGAKVGLFSTRSPYRPNPVGLTLAKLEKVEGKVSTSLR